MRTAVRIEARSMITTALRSAVAGLTMLTLMVATGAVPIQIAQTHV